MIVNSGGALSRYQHQVATEVAVGAIIMHVPLHCVSCGTVAVIYSSHLTANQAAGLAELDEQALTSSLRSYARTSSTWEACTILQHVSKTASCVSRCRQQSWLTTLSQLQI